MKFEDQSHEETERQPRCALSKAWNLAQNIDQLKEKDKATFFLPAEDWVLPVAETEELEETEFMVDSGASMHMASKKDLKSAELETMRTSRSPTTVTTANGEVQTREEATVNVKELDLFVTVMLLEETPAVLSLKKLCEDHGKTYHLTSGQKTHLTKNDKITDCNIIRSPWFTDEFLHNTHTHFFSIFITGFCIWRQAIRLKSSTPKKWKYECEELRGNRSQDRQKPKTKNQNKNEGRDEVHSDLLHDLPDWLQEFREKLVDESGLSDHGETLSMDIKTLPVLLMNYQWSREQKWNWTRASTVSFLPSRETQTANLLEDENNNPSCRRRAGTVVPKRKILVIW